jgi:hypothetical protein
MCETNRQSSFTSKFQNTLDVIFYAGMVARNFLEDSEIAIPYFNVLSFEEPHFQVNFFIIYLFLLTKKIQLSFLFYAIYFGESYPEPNHILLGPI